jgi:hypothetical protein
MARLTDPERLAKYEAALREWACSGFISYTRRADAWIRANLEKCTQKTINELLYRYVILGGGEIDEVVEKNADYRKEHEFHHDIRPPFRGKMLYVETRLCYDQFDPKVDPTILVVNVKWA